MDNKLKFLVRLAFCVVIVLAFGNTAQKAVAFQAYTHTDLTDKVDEMFKQWDNEDSPGAAVGIFKDGRIIYARGYGIASLEHSLLWTPQTVSRVGSISKQFIGMCIAILVQQGKLGLNDDIRKYLPGWPDYDGSVLIKNLLHHTSGVREYLTLVDLIGKPEGSGYVYTPNDLVKMLSRQKELNFKPGKEYSYSNSGYFLLSEIVSRVSGMKTSAFAKKYVFDPLGMDDTHFHDDPNMIVKNRAYGYSPKDEGGYRLDILRLKVIGDLGVFTTVEDFFKWDQNFFDNKLGDGTQNLIDIMLTRGKLNNGEEIPYALGLNINKYGGIRTIGHGGSAVGYRANYMQFPDQGFSIVILSNLSTFNTGGIVRKIAELYLVDQFSEPPVPRQRQRRQEERAEPITLSSSKLQEYAGDYYSDELDVTYTFKVEDNNLVLKLLETSNILTPYSTDSFGWGRRRLNFTQDREKRIIGFILQSGRVQNLKFRKTRAK